MAVRLFIYLCHSITVDHDKINTPNGLIRLGYGFIFTIRDRLLNFFSTPVIAAKMCNSFGTLCPLFRFDKNNCLPGEQAGMRLSRCPMPRRNIHRHYSEGYFFCRKANPNITTPPIIIGNDNHCPMLKLSARRPRKSSGSRANSARKRKIP